MSSFSQHFYYSLDFLILSDFLIYSLLNLCIRDLPDWLNLLDYIGTGGEEMNLRAEAGSSRQGRRFCRELSSCGGLSRVSLQRYKSCMRGRLGFCPVDPNVVPK